MNRLLNLDVVLTQRLTLPIASKWRIIARYIAHVGDGPYVFGGGGVVYLLGWALSSSPLRWAMVVVGIAVLLTMGVVTLIKFTFRRPRPRPPGEFVAFHYDVYSFPSGHAARLAALTTAMASFYPQVGLFLAVVTLGVALARVMVGVHYLGDILVGLGVGLLVAALTLRLI